MQFSLDRVRSTAGADAAFTPFAAQSSVSALSSLHNSPLVSASAFTEKEGLWSQQRPAAVGGVSSLPFLFPPPSSRPLSSDESHVLPPPSYSTAESGYGREFIPSTASPWGGRDGEIGGQYVGGGDIPDHQPRSNAFYGEYHPGTTYTGGSGLYTDGRAHTPVAPGGMPMRGGGGGEYGRGPHSHGGFVHPPAPHHFDPRDDATGMLVGGMERFNLGGDGTTASDAYDRRTGFAYSDPSGGSGFHAPYQQQHPHQHHQQHPAAQQQQDPFLHPSMHLYGHPGIHQPPAPVGPYGHVPFPSYTARDGHPYTYAPTSAQESALQRLAGMGYSDPSYLPPYSVSGGGGRGGGPGGWVGPPSRSHIGGHYQHPHPHPLHHGTHHTTHHPTHHERRGEYVDHRLLTPHPQGSGGVMGGGGGGGGGGYYSGSGGPSTASLSGGSTHTSEAHMNDDDLALAAMHAAAHYSVEAVSTFRAAQLDVLRTLLLRRLYLLTRRPAHARMTPEAIRIALHVFGLPAVVYDIISRPLRGTVATSAFRRGALPDGVGSGDGATGTAAASALLVATDGIPAGEDVEIAALIPPTTAATAEASTASVDASATAGTLSGGVTATAEASSATLPPLVDCGLQFTDSEGVPLPEEALGWWPEGLILDPASLALDASGGDSSSGGSHGGGGSASGGVVEGEGKPSASFDGTNINTAGGRGTTGTGTVGTGTGGAIMGFPQSEGEVTAERVLAVSLLGALTADLIARKRFRTKLCHSWMRGGVCPRGNGCDYAHGVHELRLSNETRDSRFRTRLCRTWVATCGTFCPHSDKCAFAHGVHQLRLRLPDADEELQHLLASAKVATATASASASASSGGGGGGRGAAIPGASPTSLSDASDSPSGSGGATDSSGTPSFNIHTGSGGSSSGGAMPPSLRRFKAQLCRAWLQGAAEGGLIAAVKLVQERTEDVSTLRFDACRAGSRRCPRGDLCPHAHGLAELRLPAVTEQIRLIEALACEAPHLRPGFTVSESADGGISLRDLTLMLIASGLLTTNLPAQLIPRVASVAALLGSNAQLPPTAIFPDFDGLPFAFAKALSSSVVNPMLQVVLPYTASDRPGTGSRRVESDLPPGHRVGLAKIISAVGNESADTALLSGALALGVIDCILPLHMLDATDLSVDPRVTTSAATGRYGVLLRRRIELKAALTHFRRTRTGNNGVTTGRATGSVSQRAPGGAPLPPSYHAMPMPTGMTMPYPPGDMGGHHMEPHQPFNFRGGGGVPTPGPKYPYPQHPQQQQLGGMGGGGGGGMSYASRGGEVYGVVGGAPTQGDPRYTRGFAAAPAPGPDERQLRDERTRWN